LTLSASDLVFCAGTLFERDFREVVEAAAAGGFRGISIFPAQVARSREAGLRDGDLRKLLLDHELEVAEVECVLSWLAREQVPEAAHAMLGEPPEVFLDLAEALGAETVLATDGFGALGERDDIVDAFRAFCDLAAERSLRVKWEFLPWSITPDAASALAFLEEVDRAHVGLMVDSWHVFRGANDLSQIRALPGERIFGVQLNDAPREPVLEDLPMDSMHHRLVPGDGAIDLVGLVQALDSTGMTAPIGAEVFSDVWKTWSAADVGRTLGEATRALLDRSRRPAPGEV
jgi:sugar phosphate isomerase/epimerase